jgi:hypothetical protein
MAQYLRIICRKAFRFTNPRIKAGSIDLNTANKGAGSVNEQTPIEDRDYFDTMPGQAGPGRGATFGDPQEAPQWIRAKVTGLANFNTYTNAVKDGDLIVIAEDGVHDGPEASVNAAVTAEAVTVVMGRGYSEAAAKEIVMREGAVKVLASSKVENGSIVELAKKAPETSVPTVTDPPAHLGVDLDKLTKAQLIEHASEHHDLDLDATAKKEDLVAAIEAARNPEESKA